MRSAMVLITALVVAVGITLLPTRLFRGIPLLSLSSGEQAEPTDGPPIAGTVYVTLSPSCPISRGYLPTLNRLHEACLGSQVSVVGLIPSVPAATIDIDAFRREFDIVFPLAVDRRGRLCEQLQVTHMPEAVLVDHRGQVRYRGRIDDRYVRVAAAPREVREHSLANAVERFRTGHLSAVVHTQPVGCLIETSPDSAAPVLSANTTVTFTQHVAPILYHHCTRCHRDGELAPFALLNYDDAVAHAAQIREMVTRRLMPPWRPSQGVISFQNDCRLPETDVRKLQQWVDTGLPRGPQSALPTPPTFATGWQMGPPDVELVMPEAFTVPADGPDIYQHFVIPTGLSEGRLIRGFEFRPGAPEVVHHAFLYYDTTGEGRRLDAADPGPGYARVGSPGFAVSGSLGGWGPGGLPSQLPEGSGRPLEAQADLVLQVHYHPCGRKVADQSRIGLYFAADWSRQYVTSVMVADVDLAIPAGAAEHRHQAEWRLPVDTVVMDITPHMHVLGKSVHAQAVLPTGDILPLIEIQDWDFYWQDTYTFSEPIELPAGTVLQLECVFDNSADNPLNPNSPPQDVYWGDFSDDEMGIIYLQATTHTLDDYHTLNREAQDYFESEYARFERQRDLRNAAQQASTDTNSPAQRTNE